MFVRYPQAVYSKQPAFVVTLCSPSSSTPGLRREPLCSLLQHLWTKKHCKATIRVISCDHRPYVPRVLISFLIFTFYFKSFIKLFPLLELLIFKIFSLSFSVHLLNSSQDILIVFCGRCFSSCVIRSPCKISAFSCAVRAESTPDQSCWTIHLPIAAVYKYPWAFGRLRLPVTVLLAS